MIEKARAQESTTLIGHGLQDFPDGFSVPELQKALQQHKYEPVLVTQLHVGLLKVAQPCRPSWEHNGT